MSKTLVWSPFTVILAVPQMEIALRLHFEHNLNGIANQLAFNQADGVISPPSLIQAELDMQAFLADSGRISRLAEKLVKQNYARAKAARKDSTKAERKAKQLAVSMAAEAAKDKRAQGGGNNKHGQKDKKKGRK